jgi:uncharacterized protein YegJ (DUF2314 family)
MKKMKKLLLALACTAGLSGHPVLAEDPVFPFEEGDPAMSAAIAEARATLPLFLTHALDADGNSLEGAAIKVAMPTAPGSQMSVEHIWIVPFARAGDGSFIGLLANEPAELGEMVVGDQVSFDEAMVSDWHFNAPSGRFWGSFTSRVMHASGAFGDTPYADVFEVDPIPPDWR